MNTIYGVIPGWGDVTGYPGMGMGMGWDIGVGVHPYGTTGVRIPYNGPVPGPLSYTVPDMRGYPMDMAGMDMVHTGHIHTGIPYGYHAIWDTHMPCPHMQSPPDCICVPDSRVTGDIPILPRATKRPGSPAAILGTGPRTKKTKQKSTRTDENKQNRTGTRKQNTPGQTPHPPEEDQSGAPKGKQSPTPRSPEQRLSKLPTRKDEKHEADDTREAEKKKH